MHVFQIKRNSHNFSGMGIMKFICKNFPGMSVNFRDESNDSSSVLISYSDATVTALNHPPIVRSKSSFARATATVP